MAPSRDERHFPRVSGGCSVGSSGGGGGVETGGDVHINTAGDSPITAFTVVYCSGQTGAEA